MSRKVRFYNTSGLTYSVDGHIIIHHDQVVGTILFLKLSLHHFNYLTSIKGLITLKAVLLQDAVGGHKIKVVMIDEKYFSTFL